jgi:hypothetical protein
VPRPPVERARSWAAPIGEASSVVHEVPDHPREAHRVALGYSVGPDRAAGRTKGMGMENRLRSETVPRSEGSAVQVSGV